MAAPRGEVMGSMPPLAAPFPWFGGKSRAASRIWERLGNPGNMVEPFAGSLAVLLGRPHAPGIETVNDVDGFLCCVWRALAADPEAVAQYASWPANENDLHARHVWLKAQRATMTAHLEGDPNYYDAHIAGWWLWGISLWIGAGWCSTTAGGPWEVRDGQLLHLGNAGQGVSRQRLHLGNAGRGVSRQLLHLGDAGRGVSRKRLHLGGTGQGVSRQLLHLGGGGGSAHYGTGVHAKHAQGDGLLAWFLALQQRLRRVRVCCGDWLRVMGPSVLDGHGLTGVILDPPYLGSERDTHLYATDDHTIAHAVRAWAIAHGDNPLLRIVLCGYESADYAMPPTWDRVCWTPNGGMGNQGQGRGRANKGREVLWFNKSCLPPQQPGLFPEEVC